MDGDEINGDENGDSDSYQHLFTDSDSDLDSDQSEQPVLLVPELPVAVAPDQLNAPPNLPAPTENEIRTNIELSRQQRWKYGVLFMLYKHPRFHSNLARVVFQFAKPRFNGTILLPDAQSTIHSTHIHQNKTGIIVTREAGIYIIDLKTGHLWTRSQDSLLIHQFRPEGGRIKAIAFHPIQPILAMSLWHTPQIIILRYPNTSTDSTRSNQVMIFEMDHSILQNGLTILKNALLVQTTMHSLVYPTDNWETVLRTGELDNVIEFGFPDSSKFNQLRFMNSDQVQIWRQSQSSGTQQRPLQLAIIPQDVLTESSPSTQFQTFLNVRQNRYFYGPGSSILNLIEVRGKVIVTTALHSILVWNFEDGTHLHTFRNHWGPGRIQSLTSIPDSLIVATASFDKSIRLWNMERLEQITTHKGQRFWNTGTRKPQSISVSKCGHALVGFDNKSIELYEL